MSEVEYEDGTNVKAGLPFFEFSAKRLPWYKPSESIAISRWREKLEQLREQFEQLKRVFAVVECNLTQTLIPNPSVEKPFLPDRSLLLAGPGLELEPATLFSHEGDLIGLFPFHDVRGKPMLRPDGNPTPIRLGFTRYMRSNWIIDGSREAPIPQFRETLQDASSLLFQLPPFIASKIWMNWPNGFTQCRSESLWLDALFELAWQRPAGSPLHIYRYAKFQNASVGLLGNGLFPRLPQASHPASQDYCPHEHGYPRAVYSKIPDVARASINAIDELLDVKESVPRKAPPQAENSAASKNAGPPTKGAFISYAHKDKKFLDQLLIHLKPFKRNGSISSWSDRQIAPGSKWFPEIQNALANAQVAILLVSPDFLASDFIHDHELAPILKRAEANGIIILWIPIRSSSYKVTPIAQYQAMISPDKPIAEMMAERDRAWVSICEDIIKALDK